MTVEGPAFRLRPVAIEDARFIHELRTDPERSRYIHRGAADLRGQQEWIENYFARPGDYYFLIENRASGEREGTAGIYNIDAEKRCAEWGRWIVRAGSLAALESACLVYRAGFERLGLKAMVCRTILENASAVAFHDSFGVERVRVLPNYFERDGRSMDAVEGRLSRARWNVLRANTLAKAARAATWVNGNAGPAAGVPA
jgi:RimJ/RimL family protein N-acetyltransferase